MYLEYAAVTAEPLGRVRESTGDRAAALAAFRDGLKLFEKLRAATPEQARSARDAKLSLHRALLVRLLVNGRFNEAGETVLSLAAALIAE
jgi:hypothetical protein